MLWLRGLLLAAGTCICISTRTRLRFRRAEQRGIVRPKQPAQAAIERDLVGLVLLLCGQRCPIERRSREHRLHLTRRLWRRAPVIPQRGIFGEGVLDGASDEAACGVGQRCQALVDGWQRLRCRRRSCIALHVLLAGTTLARDLGCRARRRRLRRVSPLLRRSCHRPCGLAFAQGASLHAGVQNLRRRSQRQALASFSCRARRCRLRSLARPHELSRNKHASYMLALHAYIVPSLVVRPPKPDRCCRNQVFCGPVGERLHRCRVELSVPRHQPSRGLVQSREPLLHRCLHLSIEPPDLRSEALVRKGREEVLRRLRMQSSGVIR